MQFLSKEGQDRYLFENFFRGKRGGKFLDVGPGAGRAISACHFYERFMGWQGLSVEPARAAELASLLEQHALFSLDLCSIDAGGSGPGILEGLDLGRFKVGVFVIADDRDDPRVRELLERQGYDFCAKLGQDRLFRRRDFPRLALATAICAVWHGDPRRGELLQRHAHNLLTQTVPVELIYAFDGNDTPPAALPGRKIVAQDALTIYQAWNLALALVETPFVMNLNLDDRIAPDAVEKLTAALLGSGAAIAAGDWKICYSQEATDAVVPCYAAHTLPFVTEWPPPTGTQTRLGSGTGERGTLGPATLWRMDAHFGAPRYPWRLPDGTLLRIAGDTAWWTVLQHLKKSAVRLPTVIGNYHSHPDAQAEFRGPPEEAAAMSQLGISLL